MRAASPLPLAVGFGISTPAQARGRGRTSPTAWWSGSALVERLGPGRAGGRRPAARRTARRAGPGRPGAAAVRPTPAPLLTGLRRADVVGRDGARAGRRWPWIGAGSSIPGWRSGARRLVVALRAGPDPALQVLLPLADRDRRAGRRGHPRPGHGGLRASGSGSSSPMPSGSASCSGRRGSTPAARSSGFIAAYGAYALRLRSAPSRRGITPRVPRPRR